MMNSPAAAEGAHPGVVPDIIGDDTPTHWPAALWNGLSRPGISVLDKLIKTCPVWLQLCMEKDQASQVLGSEPAGIFLVRRDADLKTLILSIHVSSENTADEVSEYSIKEEKSMLYLEGSVLVFEDIFKLVAFYCVSRDVLPFTLRLPHAILEAKTYTELDTISNLGMGFWDSTLNIKGGGSIVHQKGTDLGNIQFSSAKSSQHSSRGTNQGSCEIELLVGNDRLWFVNPIFIEECSNSLFHEKPPMESHSVDSHVGIVRSSYRRPPPPPPPPPSLLSHAVKESGECSQGRVTSSVGVKPYKEMRMDRKEVEGKDQCASDQSPKKPFYPAIPPRRRSSEKHAGESLVAVCRVETCETQEEGNTVDLHSSHEGTNSALAQNVPADMMVTHLVHIGGEEEVVSPTESEGVPEDWATAKSTPVPPPRKKRHSHQAMHTSLVPLKPTIEEAIDRDSAELQNLSLGDSEAECCSSSVATNGDPTGDGRSSPDSKKSDTSLNSPAQYTSISEQDSLSTSSTEDDPERVVSRPIKKTHSIMLDKAKHRLSLANLSSVFTAFLSADRKVQKRITELAQDTDSYFGRLVQDFKAYSLEMMGKHSSSTEMLQEIRMMMTQLKSYLLQSTELQTIIDPTVHKEEKLEVIIEAALCKCVLKPLRQAIESHLCIIHTSDGALRLLKENQLVIQATTTTDLGVTTPVPEAVVMDKILSKFSNMHKAYSPEKKIAILLKSCKLIYDSMSLGNPGKPYGADDFLPVLMYVLARSNLTELLLDVEYMMELMDPALQLGEGSYYLTTTYGALEQIKNYDKVTVTRQLSVEVQDSIHRWEKRRTLSKARVSRSSVQDFITISFQEPDAQTRTLATRPDTSAALLAHQCAEKFEVADPQAYSLFVLVDGRCLRLASDSQPHQIKSYLLKSETKRDFNFLYKEIGSDEAAAIPVIKETDFLE